MSKHLMRIFIAVIICSVYGMVLPGLSYSGSLAQYLNGGITQSLAFRCDAAGSNMIGENNAATGISSPQGAPIMEKLHQYTGYGTIIAAVAAGVSGSDNGFHKGAGDAAAVLAVATCMTGFMEYRDYFDMDEGLSIYNIHIVLATLATAGFVATVVDANSKDDDNDDKGGHAGLGIGSTALMAIPIVILHF